MRKLLHIGIIFLCGAATCLAQTTVTIPNTVKQAGLPRPGVNVGGNELFGQAQLLKSMNYANAGYMPSAYYQSTWTCDGGGTQSTTQWYDGNTGNFPANFFVGASYIAMSQDGTSYGSGTITASTANTSTGITFTLGTPLSSACNPSNQKDMLIVSLLTGTTGLNTPQTTLPFICSGATFDTSDTDPLSTNTIQSLEMPTGCAATFNLDQAYPNVTNTNSSLVGNTNWLNLNGSYAATFKAKCLTAGCSLTVALNRSGGATYIAGTTVSPTFNATPGDGWTTYSYPFTASETGTTTLGSITYSLTSGSTGVALVQDIDLVEGSTLTGNTTVYRDAVVRKLQNIHPGTLRFMDSGDWCSDVPDMIAPLGNMRWCTVSEGNYEPKFFGNTPVGYASKLQLALFIGADAWISVGNLSMPADWTTLINWLANTADGPSAGVSWIQAFATAGHKIYLENGNEAWNTAAEGGLWGGNGTIYGHFLGPNMAAAKAASGYNSAVIKLVGNGFVTQGNGADGWDQLTLTTAQATTNGLPDFIDNAAYMLGVSETVTLNGTNIATTGAPWLDEWAEDTNWNSASPPSGSTSLYNNRVYAGTFGVASAVYEMDFGNTEGVGMTQTQLDQVSASVGTALGTVQNALLMQRDAGFTGPLNVFVLPLNGNTYTCVTGTCVSGATSPLWGIERPLGCGPGQLSTCNDVDRPVSIAMQIVNNAIGSNNNLMGTTQSGTPTFSYPGGQVYSPAPYQIQANASVPYVNCFSYSNGSGNWTTICFNNNLTTAETVTLAGAGAPTGSVTQTTFPGPSNLITDHNENYYIGSSSIAPVVGIPSATSTSGTSYSIPAASMIALTYSTGGSTVAAPVLNNVTLNNATIN
jgi:hypothetical protein